MAVLTVSREYGSRGEEISLQVAKALGYSYFDKEILADVAKAADMAEATIAQYDEKDEHGLRSFLKKLFVPPNYAPFFYLSYDHFYMSSETVPPVKEGKPLDEAEVTVFFREVIEKLWKRGRVIIVGRGSQKILAAKTDVLHVRFIGSIGDRAKFVGYREGVTFAEALEKIERIDEQRADYLKRHYGASWGNPKLYHLIINTSLMSDAQVVSTVVAAVRSLEQT